MERFFPAFLTVFLTLSVPRRAGDPRKAVHGRELFKATFGRCSDRFGHGAYGTPVANKLRAFRTGSVTMANPRGAETPTKFV